ncbi:hypothetical protein P7C73_g4061, partial [Tremellales sp. Uapishka_1]
MPPRRSTRAPQPKTGDKRPAPDVASESPKKAKKEKDGKLQVGDDGEVTLGKSDDGEDKKEESEAKKGDEEKEVAPEENDKEDNGPSVVEKESTPEFDEPRHGTLEQGHIYFLYRPKIELDEAESIDDISKFHILLLPTTGPHSTSHFHRIIEIGKKKLPDPGAKHQVIWGLVSGVGGDKAALKTAFGGYEYETKTRGTRHQGPARPAARGHYILHSPQDKLADSPDHNRQRDFKCLLAYEISVPAAEDFGAVQTELGLEPKGAVVLQVKEPSADSRGNPRAAAIPREKRANDLFHGRRFIPANPPRFLDHQGTELLVITSPHEFSDSMGENGEQVEEDLDGNTQHEKVGVEEALKELGMSKKDTEIQALEGEWA